MHIFIQFLMAFLQQSLMAKVIVCSDIYSMYEWVRRMTDQIFIWWMNRSGELLTEYSLDVCRGQADYRPNINLVYA